MIDDEQIDNLDDNNEEESWAFIMPKLGAIDKVFFPFDSDTPFEYCTICKKLFDNHSDYLIEKAIKGNDVIFELAICIPCAQDMRKQLSKESLERIDEYMSVVNFEERTNYFLQNQSENINDYIGNCLVSGKPIDKEKEYQVYGYCQGDQMLYAAMPYAISGEVMEEIQELLSPETKQAMDDFMDQYLIPDDLRDLLKGRPVLL